MESTGEKMEVQPQFSPRVVVINDEEVEEAKKRLRLKSSNVFINIGRVWGDVVVTDPSADDNLDWSYGVICVRTSRKARIDELVVVRCGESKCKVRAWETEEDEESDWEEGTRLSGFENPNVNEESTQPLENVNMGEDNNNEEDTCRGEHTVGESLNDEDQVGIIGNSINFKINAQTCDVGLDRNKVIGLSPDLKSNSGPRRNMGEREPVEDGLTPNKERLSEKLKILLSRETPIQNKIAVVEEEKMENTEQIGRCIVENRVSTVERRMTRSRSKEMKIWGNLVTKTSRDSSISEGIAQRMEEIRGNEA
ncbi:hypothetical protein L2E82_31257 [Cichorium intybus]|uniref:Uncharacterized protein n=1 Tax=Cichorium intybus TaxID=13427 RepID=A0ACB9D2D6_CICIN|nr:hypothetical protein L2E82_31257 [Cichorium intybus]